MEFFVAICYGQWQFFIAYNLHRHYTPETNTMQGGIFSITKRFDGRVCRFIEFFIGKLSEKIDPLDDAMNDDGDTEHSKEENKQLSIDGFMSLPDDMELPFD